MRAARAGIAVALVLTSGCASRHSSSGRPGTAVRTTLPTTRTTATPTSAPETTTTTVVLVPQETPDLAASALFAAWRSGDRHAALVVAVSAAVDSLFAAPAQDFSDRGCQVPLGGQSSCAFAIGGEAAIAQVQTISLAGGWVVQSVTVSANQ